MIERESDFKPAGRYAFFAAKEARQKSLCNASKFTNEQHIRAERVKLALELVYSCEEVSVTNCEKWIRVKVHKAKVVDPKTLALLENDWAIKGITKMITNQGIIYRVI